MTRRYQLSQSSLNLSLSYFIKSCGQECCEAGFNCYRHTFLYQGKVVLNPLNSQLKILDELLTNLFADMESKYLYKLATLERKPTQIM